MKLIYPLLFALLAFPQTSLLAQAKHLEHHIAHSTRPAARSSEAHACVKVGELSSKIPALPTGASCPRALYTVSREPSIKLDYASPMANKSVLRDTFGIQTTTITLAYIDTKIGTGALVEPDKFLSILYSGYLADGTEFDASSKHGGDPIVLQYGKHSVILGWDTGLDGMRVGGKRRLFIPYELAYGASGSRGIPPKSELIFDVELVAEGDTAPAPKPAIPAPSKVMPPTEHLPPATPKSH